jgi:hypothetical protein
MSNLLMKLYRFERDNRLGYAQSKEKARHYASLNRSDLRLLYKSSIGTILV